MSSANIYEDGTAELSLARYMFPAIAVMGLAV